MPRNLHIYKHTHTMAAILTVSLLIGACSNMPVDPENSSQFKIATGSTVTLHEPVTIPADTTTVYIQKGVIKTYFKIKYYHPHCALEIKARKDDDLIIQPGEFTIYRSYFNEVMGSQDSGFLPSGKFLYTGGGMAIMQMQRVMYLRSAEQPDVFRLTCTQWALSTDYSHLKIAEVRQALGALMSLQLAAGDSI
ncbi:MAG TPA: hypothetical protein VIM41_06870 [Gammaproteobacteria bacterium]